MFISANERAGGRHDVKGLGNTIRLVLAGVRLLRKLRGPLTFDVWRLPWRCASLESRGRGGLHRGWERVRAKNSGTPKRWMMAAVPAVEMECCGSRTSLACVMEATERVS